VMQREWIATKRGGEVRDIGNPEIEKPEGADDQWLTRP
jgi:hypothetical protein